MTGTPNANEEQTGQPNATVTPGQGNEEINGATKPGEVSPKPEENNPAVTEPGTTAPGNTNQGTQVKPKRSNSYWYSGATGDQNTQQGNTEQNNQNAEPSAPGTTDQASATVKPGSAPNQDTEVKPNPDQNNNSPLVKTLIKQVKVLK